MAIRDILDRQANTIEYILHTHGIQAQVDGGNLSPRLTHFHVALPAGVHPRQIAPIVTELADALGVTSCRLAPGEEGVYLEAPRPDPVPVRLLPLVQRVADVVPPVTATLGLDGEGTPLLLRLNSPDVDPLIISGNRGAGKSSLMGGMALSLALHNSPDRLRLLLLDCTGGDSFAGLQGLPHLACPTANDPVAALASLRWALRTLARRNYAHADNELLFDDDAPGDDEALQYEEPVEEPALVIMIDGVDRLCATGNERANAEALDALDRLLTEGSRHHIHLVVAAEQAGCLNGINPRWGARITGWVSSSEAARLATGVKGSGAQALLGAGDFLIALNAELIRFQAAAVSDGEVTKAIGLIRSCVQSTPAEDDDQAPLRPRKSIRRQQRNQEEPVLFRRTWNVD